ILRVDVSGDAPGFATPKDNPFRNRADALPEIWAYGLRNPYRCSFDRQNSDLFIGDVGQDAREELDHEIWGAPGGRNYGWHIFEGRMRNPAVPGPEVLSESLDSSTPAETFTPPFLDYA